MAENKSTFREEFGIIPSWAIVVALLVFIGLPAAFVLFFLLPAGQKTPLFMPVLWVVGGGMLALVVLLVGYVNADAKRRGMNALLWTLLVIFVPNAIGFIIYFLMRQPLLLRCPQCLADVKADFNFCPKCSTELTPVCSKCGHGIRGGDVFCPYCGNSLTAVAP